MTKRSETALPLSDDWTAVDGRSNSSALYVNLSSEIARLLRDSAHSLIAGRTDEVGGLILAQLAHKHGLRPRVERRGDEFHCPNCGHVHYCWSAADRSFSC